MNPETTTAVREVLTFLLTTLRDTRAFAVEQAPYVVKEMLAWYWVQSVAEAGISALVVAFLGYKFWRLAQSATRIEEAQGECGALHNVQAWMLLVGVILSLSLFALCDGVLGMIKVTSAPRLVVLEMVKALAQSQ